MANTRTKKESLDKIEKRLREVKAEWMQIEGATAIGVLYGIQIAIENVMKENNDA